MDETPDIGPDIGPPILVALFIPALPLPILFLVSGLLSGMSVASYGPAIITALIGGLIISAAHLIFLGLPSVWLLRKLKYFHWWSVTISGFILGCIPTAVLSRPKYNKGEGYVLNGVEFVVDGVVTSAGWLSYIQGVAEMGGYGALAGLAFWLAWRRSNSAIDADAMRRST